MRSDYPGRRRPGARPPAPALALVDAMRQHKPELHALLEAFEERAAILEYDGRLPRDEAERLA